jgi:hypothetical protein
MTIFNDTAVALGVSQDTRDRAWSAVGAAGISPDDPEVVRLLINEHIRATLTSLTGDLETAASKAIREFGDAAAHGEAAAQARLETRTTELAQTVSARLATAIEQTLDKRAEAKLDIATTTQWACGVILFAVGLYLGSLGVGYVNVPDDELNRWLQAQAPWFLVFTGTVAFLAVRLVVAWTASSPLIRFILALPPRDVTRHWGKRDY